MFAKRWFFLLISCIIVLLSCVIVVSSSQGEETRNLYNRIPHCVIPSRCLQGWKLRLFHNVAFIFASVFFHRIRIRYPSQWQLIIEIPNDFVLSVVNYYLPTQLFFDHLIYPDPDVERLGSNVDFTQKKITRGDFQPFYNKLNTFFCQILQLNNAPKKCRSFHLLYWL